MGATRTARSFGYVEAGPVATLELLMRLRGRGVQNTAVLRAFESVPRALFLPTSHRDLAVRDLALPIGCGQSLCAPSELAVRLSWLEVRPGQRVLDIGGGAGYAAALMAAMGAIVTSVERFRSLATEAAARLSGIGATGVSVVHGDGLAPVEGGPFDRIFMDVGVLAPPEAVLATLAGDGVCLFGRPGQGGATLIRLRPAGAARWTEEALGPARVDPAIHGVARHL